LREYLGNEYKEVDDGEEDIENDTNYNDNLRKLVKAEIESCSKEKLDKFNIDADEEDQGDNDEIEKSNTKSEDTISEENKSEQVTEEVNDSSSKKPENESKPSDVDAATVKSDTTTVKSDTTTAEPKTVESELGSAKPEKIPEENTSTPSPVVEENDDGAMSDNEIENKEVTEIIDKEVEKLSLDPIDNGLKVEELNFDFDDLSELEEVYQDAPKLSSIEPTIIEPITITSKDEILSSNNEKTELNLGITDIPTEQNIKFEVKEPEPAIKTIIIDTKKGASLTSNKIVNDDNNLEINDFEDDEGSDSDDENSKLKQKVYNRYSKQRDYSFFN
jgi:hypothetical protein